MQDSQHELREIFRRRVRDSFSRARICVHSARQARQEGNTARLRKLLTCAPGYSALRLLDGVSAR